MKNIAILFGILAACSCDSSRGQPVSSTGISKATAIVKPGADGLTSEQRNVRQRLDIENAPGAIKHLYVISAYSGQVLIYSTVTGKVTSSGKRLTPTSISGNPGDGYCSSGFDIEIGNSRRCTQEVLQDDGTYGSSVEYLFWFDSKNIYHQHYVAGGQIVHVSDQPLAVKSIILNLELGVASEPEAPKPAVPVSK